MLWKLFALRFSFGLRRCRRGGLGLRRGFSLSRGSALFDHRLMLKGTKKLDHFHGSSGTSSRNCGSRAHAGSRSSGSSRAFGAAAAEQTAAAAGANRIPCTKDAYAHVQHAANAHHQKAVAYCCLLLPRHTRNIRVKLQALRRHGIRAVDW